MLKNGANKGENMIICEIENVKGNPDACTFKCEVEGHAKDVLLEAMRINADLILKLRKSGIPDENIEKQLAYNIAGGFHIAKDIEKQRGTVNGKAGTDRKPEKNES